MRHARLLPVGLLSVAVVVGCTTAAPGWTYAPAPSVTPAPSAASSGAPSPASSGAPSPASSGAPSPAASGAAVVTISASNVTYEQTTVTAPAGTPFQIVFDNKDAGTPHNVSIHQTDASGPEVFKGEIFNGVATKTYDVPALQAGTYAFVCSVHAFMVGTLTAR